MRIATRAITVALAATLIVAAAGCGSDKSTSASSRGTTRTMDITMTDMAYTPAQMDVSKGETVTMRFRNNGTVKHEAMLGDNATQMRHHDEMTASTMANGHGGGHDETQPGGAPEVITVEPGMTGEITHTFSESGTILIGCHVPGHWEAGMKATVNIG